MEFSTATIIKLKTRTFNGIEMISQRDLVEVMGSKLASRYKPWSKFKAWTIFTGGDSITDNLTYHCHRKDFSPVKESNNYALHYISKQFIKDIFMKHYNYNIDGDEKILSKPTEKITLNNLLSVTHKTNNNNIQSKTIAFIKGSLKEYFMENKITTPLLITLEDDQKFVNDNGELCSVRVYGESPNVYCSLVDIEREFEYDQLCNNIMKGNITLKPMVDIVYFDPVVKDITDKLNKTVKARFHITPSGMIKLIANSSNPTMINYNKWLQKAFFTNLLGTEDQRMELASDILKSNIKNIRDSLSISNSRISVVYIMEFTNLFNDNSEINPYLDSKLKSIVQMLFTLYGTDFQLYKFGFTKDFDTRLKQYTNDHKDHVSVNMFQCVDPTDDTKCETYLRDKAKILGHKIEMGGLNDWFFTRSTMDFIQYKGIISDVGSIYGKTTAIFNKELETMKERIMWATSTLETNKRQNILELEKKDLELEKKDLELINERKGRKADNNQSRLEIENLSLKYELEKIKSKN